MLRTTQAISLEIIMRAVFGVEDMQRGAEIGDAILESISAMTPTLIFFKFLRHSFGGIGPWARFMRASQRVDTLLLSEIAARRQKGESGDDILSLMMSARYEDGGSMSDTDLRDELLTLLFAGHETTAISLAWAFYWLARQPEDMERLLSEIDALGPDPEPDAIAALPFLDAVCHEALRMHPVVPDIMRKLRKPFDLLGYTIPAGTGLAASAMLLHRREDLYPEPHRFRPSRFLERKPAPHEFIPFGGGARRCLGAAFAMYEMKIVLATLLRSHRLRLATDATVVAARRGFTFGPKGGIMMIDDGARSVPARAA
jgi:cytochrome P450